MIFLSPFIDTKLASDPRFESRGASTNRQGPIHDSPILALALEKQLAYDGYKSNIDVFCAATATNKVLNVNIPGINLDGIIPYTFPIGLPRTVISFKANVPREISDSFIEKVKKVSTVTQIEGVKNHGRAYMIEQPTAKMLQFVETYCMADAPRSSGYAQIRDSLAAASLLGYIETYLRTNTYPAFKSDDDIFTLPRLSTTAYKRPTEWLGTPEVLKKARYAEVTMTHRVGSGDKDEKEDGLWFGRESDKDLELPVSIGEVVSFARPSPAKDSRASWSSPRNVPSLPGLLFPYFNGMLTESKATLRAITGSRFIKLFGEEPKANYVNFRQNCGGFASTTTGIELSHILKGIDMSIETQTKLHLLFDGSTYLGFCLLGSKWAVQRGNVWHLPVSSADLRTELNMIKTHETSLSEIIAKMGEMNVTVSEDEIEDGCDLAAELAKLDFSVLGDEMRTDLYKWFDERVGALDFGKRAVNFGADTLAEALADIIQETEPLANHVHFPPAQDYGIFKYREAISLARFGYLVPSFSVDKGEQSVRVSSIHGDKVKGEAARKTVSKILVSMKPLKRAVKEFQAFRTYKTIYQSSSERAATYRLHAIGGEPKNRFLLRVGALIQKLESGDPSVGGPAPRKAKAVDDKPEEEYVVVDVPDF